MLGNFLHGLAGRRLKLEQGEAAYTDGERIFLPAITARFAGQEDNFKLAKASVALLWAQTRFGTLRADLQAACADYPHPERALAQFHGLETLRLAACIARELPGSAPGRCYACRASLGEEVPQAWQALRNRLAHPEAQVEDSLALSARGLCPA